MDDEVVIGLLVEVIGLLVEVIGLLDVVSEPVIDVVKDDVSVVFVPVIVEIDELVIFVPVLIEPIGLVIFVSNDVLALVTRVPVDVGIIGDVSV